MYDGTVTPRAGNPIVTDSCPHSLLKVATSLVGASPPLASMSPAKGSSFQIVPPSIENLKRRVDCADDY